MPAQDAIAAKLKQIRETIAAAAEEAGRDPAAVTLVAVSKLHPVGAVEAALAAGQRVFGENRVQEAQLKYGELKSRLPDIELHLIGPLQTNKAEDAVALFDTIEVLDRPKLANALAKAMQKTGRRPVCFVQINTGEEEQKAGIAPGEADAFIAACRDDYGLPVEGVMCIPPLDEEPALHFALLKEIAERNGLEKLSMGMSGDFETAVRLGATHVRIGTAIFGQRPPKDS
ncbi:MAG: YggS family pyridoxal phosphate-dependent enzyme [Rhodovibrionaceae bacterium]